MKNILFVFAIPLMFLYSCENIEPVDRSRPTSTVEDIDYSARAKEIYDFVFDRYGIKDGTYKGLVNENSPKASNDPACSYIWAYDWYVCPLKLMDDLGYEVGYLDAVESYQRYWMPNGNDYGGVKYPTPGYSAGSRGVVDGGNNGDRYYDDNSIVGTNLMDAYVKTGDNKFLLRAKATIDFVNTGWDEALGGGVWWNEPRRDPAVPERVIKPMCANGFFNLLLLKYYASLTDEKKALSENQAIFTQAKTLYAWCRTTLRDVDYVVMGSIRQDGVLERAKDPGNTATIIMCGVMLYELTKETSYLEDAKKSADASYKYFVKYRPEGGMMFPNNEPWSNPKLLQAYLTILPYHSVVETYIDTYINYCNWIYDNKRTADGYFYEYSSGDNPGRTEWIMTQNAFFESYAAIALYIKNKQ